MATPAQIKANQQNALLSSGPSSSAGKQKCSKNALKTALTGRTILLPTDDVAVYENLICIIFTKLNPETDAEKLVVQSIADTEYRLSRIPVIQSGLYAVGRAEVAGPCPDEPDPQQRAIMIEALVFRHCQKDLSNLTLQENRLRRSLEKLTAEFEKLRHERELPELARRDVAMQSLKSHSTNHSSIGSEFSIDYLLARMQFKHHAGYEHLAIFDRTWRDKNAKTPN